MNTFNVQSNNQQGGITAGIVNVGRPRRRLDDNIKGQIKANIPLSDKIDISSIMGDNEAMAFSDEVENWMKNVGYTNITGGASAIYSQPVFGIHVQKNQDGSWSIRVGSNQ